MWKLERFVKDNGRCPVDDFLDELSPRKDLPYIQLKFDMLAEHGYKLDRPHAAHLGDQIYELRVKTVNGQFRFFYFFFAGDKIIITHGIKKKTDQVPESEIEQANSYRNIYYQRHGIKR